MIHRLAPPAAPELSARLAAVVEEARKGHALADTVMQLLIERAWALPEAALHDIALGLQAVARKACALSLDDAFDSLAGPAERHEAAARLAALSRRCAEVLTYVERLQRGERLARCDGQAAAFSRAS